MASRCNAVGPITRAGMDCGPPGQPCPPPSIRYSATGWQPGRVQVFRVTGMSLGTMGSSSMTGRAKLPVAVIHAPVPPRRSISECIALLPEDSTATIDPDFAKDLEAAVESHREPLEPPAWD